MSSFAVSAFIATRMSISFLRATYPCLLARIEYHVGKPAIFDGKRFLPLTGMPIPKMLLRSTALADWEPEPLTVATWMVKSLTIGFVGLVSATSGLLCTGAVSPLCRAISPVAMWRKSLQRESHGKVSSIDLSYILKYRQSPRPNRFCGAERLQF